MKIISVRKKKRAIALAVAAIIVAAASIILVQRHIHITELRAELRMRIAETAAYTQRESFGSALVSAREALAPALELRDDAAKEEIDTYIALINTLMRADEHYSDGSYQSALYAYRAALEYASKIDGFDTGYIRDMLGSTEGYIKFFDTIHRADSLAGEGEFEAALSTYDEAARLASALSYADGQRRAAEGVLLMEEEIAHAKWVAEMTLTAEAHIEQGDLLLDDGEYDPAIEEYRKAALIYEEIGDIEMADGTSARIARAMLMKTDAERQAAAAEPSEETAADNDDAPIDSEAEAAVDAVYEFNRNISFDLSSMIDRQDRGPASMVKMGTTDDRNEGWYNGCGWIATYNMLLWLGNPQHPADIVRYFETIGGTVRGGEFGTYPHAIADYLAYLGYDVRNALFPSTHMSIDREIKIAGAGILAYLHTSAAHYVMIEYRESDDIFIVYNDSSARSRSDELGLSDLSKTGAAIDSVEAWLTQSPEILLPFSLITAG